MDTRHAEYVAYYEARVKRFEGSTLYPRTLAAERAILEAIRGAPNLEAFRERLVTGKLDLAAAQALVQDQELARAAHYDALGEPVRARLARDAAQAAAYATTVAALHEAVSAVHTRGAIELSADGPYARFTSEWKVLEDLEVLRTAVVPARWKAEDETTVRETVAQQRAAFRERTLPRLREWNAGWHLEARQFSEPRHRRLAPVPDATFARRVAQYVELLEGK